MSDLGHEETDKALKSLERKISREYKAAYKTANDRLMQFMEKFDKQDKEKLAEVAAGKITRKEYIEWRAKKITESVAFRGVRDVLAEDMSNANKIAMGMINDFTKDVYADNVNFGMYEVESGMHMATTFTLYDKYTVENLLKNDPNIIPQARLDIPKDLRWNRKKINSAITQGILSGESIPNIAKRLQSVTDMNKKAAVRNARTYTTAAENKGRVDSYKYAQNLGIKMQQEWLAVVDMRTRASHRHLDGERVDVGGTFSNGCKFPGDPSGRPEEIYNCRCTLIAALKGFPSDSEDRFMRLPDGMTYDEWKEARGMAGRERREEEGEGQNGFRAGYSTNDLTAPIRPRKRDFNDDDEYYHARDIYHKAREKYDEEFNKRIATAASVERFSSNDEFVKWASNNGITIHDEVLDKIDPRAFNETTYVLDEMFSKYPEAKDFNFEYFDGSVQKKHFEIGLDNDGLLSANGGFNFNPRYFSDYEYGLWNAFEGQTTGGLVRGDGTFGTLVRHEYGHNVQNYIETKMIDKYHMNVDDWRKNFKTFDEYKSAREAYFNERHLYQNELLSLANMIGASDYAHTNDLELFAEGFAEYTSGGNSEFGRAFGEFLKRWY